MGKQSPRKHKYTPEAYPNAGLDKAACRDPNGQGQIWCYTVSGEKKWGMCEQLKQFEMTYTVKITDVNEKPTLEAPADGLYIDEDAADGSSVGKAMKGDDEDANDSVTYSLTNDADGAFMIAPSSGQVQ